MSLVRRLFALSALSALVIAGAPAVGGAQTPTVTSVIGAADGLFVDVEVADLVPQQIPLTFGPEPSVTLPPEGGEVSDEILGVDEEAGFFALTASLVSVSAEGALGPDGFATAETTVLDLLLEEVLPVVGAQQLANPIIDAEAISATCEADLDGVSGSTTLAGVEVLGQALEEEPEPNTEIDVDVPQVGTVGLLLNGQEENPDGSLSVTPLAMFIEVGDLLGGILQIGPATCGVIEGELADELVPAPDDVVPAQPLRAAPRFTG